jgi:hypothetical protein
LTGTSGQTCGNDETWATLLVNQFLPSPSQDQFGNPESKGDSVFRCPNGLNMRWFSPTEPDPVNMLDMINAKAWRRVSLGSRIKIDHWYAANADQRNANLIGGQGRWPMRVLRYKTVTEIEGGPLLPVTKIKRSAETALLFDGLRTHDGDPAFISARHNGRRAPALPRPKPSTSSATGTTATT